MRLEKIKKADPKVCRKKILMGLKKNEEDLKKVHGKALNWAKINLILESEDDFLLFFIQHHHNNAAFFEFSEKNFMRKWLLDLMIDDSGQRSGTHLRIKTNSCQMCARRFFNNQLYILLSKLRFKLDKELVDDF